MIKPNKSIISLKIWYNNMSSFLFQNTIQLSLLGMHQCSHGVPQIFKSYSHNSCESFGHAALHANPLSLHSSWYRETFIQSSCQIYKFLKSQNRQKGDQFFYQMSDSCENCNPHSSYHTTTIGECLVDIRFAETFKLAVWACSFAYITGRHSALGLDTAWNQGKWSNFMHLLNTFPQVQFIFCYGCE